MFDDASAAGGFAEPSVAAPELPELAEAFTLNPLEPASVSRFTSSSGGAICGAPVRAAMDMLGRDSIGPRAFAKRVLRGCGAFCSLVMRATAFGSA